jgi:hypothetical protein
MRHKAASADTTRRTIESFLEAHCTHELSNDVGPVLGRLASLRDEPRSGAPSSRRWHEAVSVALTGQAAGRPH